MGTSKISKNQLKWPEVLSLAGLNAAVVISWIAYHEYQPVLIEKYKFEDLADFLVSAKAIILIVIPPIAGWLADLILKKNGKYFTVFTVGIGATAMVFMVVASILGAGPVSMLRPMLPYMIVLWLVAMNLFISPANSMIEAFAPAKKLPLVMGVLVLTTELIYALEPLVIALVRFFGDTLTFVVGGILIAGAGFVFHRVSSNEVIMRKKEIQELKKSDGKGAKVYLVIVIIGLCLGLGKAALVEVLPGFLSGSFNIPLQEAQIVAFVLLGVSAVLAFVLSWFISKFELSQLIILGIVIIAGGSLGLIFSPTYATAILGAFIVAIGFSLVNITGLPYTIQHLSARNVTYGVGIYIGASEIFSGLAERFI